MDRVMIDCPKCGIGDADEGDQDCLICKKLTMAEATYARKRFEERIRDVIRASKLLNALRVLKGL